MTDSAFALTPAFYRGRLAPSPTGYLHLGHARTFLSAAQRAAAAEGALLLRVDDLDAQRSRPEFLAGIVEDLTWLGIAWQGHPVRQSQRLHLYQDAFAQLRASGTVYPWLCSRRDLAAAAHAPHADDEDEPVYPGTCRPGTCRPGEDKTSLELQGGAVAAAWRFHVPDGQRVAFEDAIAGPQEFVAGRDFGDFVVLRRDGVPSYQLASVMDDAAMGITEVVRGRDLLRSTARQILLQRALGYAEPRWAHCALVLNKGGERLAKRDAARSLRSLREHGVTPEAVRQMAFAR